MLTTSTSGLSFIELLIGISIFSVAVLGYVNIQIKLQNMQHENHLQHQAIIMVDSLINRIQINSLNTFRNYSTKPVLNCQIPPTTYCASRPNQSSDHCTDTQLAVFDLWDIQCKQNQSIIPNLTLIINCQDINTTDTYNCSYGSLMTITANWSSSKRAPQWSIQRKASR